MDVCARPIMLLLTSPAPAVNRQKLPSDKSRTRDKQLTVQTYIQAYTRQYTIVYGCSVISSCSHFPYNILTVVIKCPKIQAN